MPKGLSLSDVVNVSVSLAPRAAAYRNFGGSLIMGDSDVIDINERIRQYSDITEVGADFASTTPEFKAATRFFSQQPLNSTLFIGRWAGTSTRGRVRGAIQTAANQVLSRFTGITNGSFRISINGASHDVTGLNLSTALSLNGVASLVQTAVAAIVPGTTVVWDQTQERFLITSPTLGPSSSIGYATPVSPAAGTDVSDLFGWNNTVNTPAPIPGLSAETLVQGIMAMVDKSADWYAVLLAATVVPSDTDYLTAAAFIEAAGSAFNSRVFGITTGETAVLDGTITNDLASELAAALYNRTFIQFSTTDPYAAVSLWARQSTVDFEAANSVITLKFKDEPGIVPEDVTETQAAALAAKNCNVFVLYQNNTAIIQEGVMCGGFFIDERVGSDWVQNRMQTDLFNYLRQAPRKVPQTEAGTHQLVATVQNACEAAVNNGLVAPGIWTAAGFGQLDQGNMLTAGYYIYAPLIASQSPADREQRKSVPLQVALKLAGAVHQANVIVTVNR